MFDHNRNLHVRCAGRAARGRRLLAWSGWAALAAFFLTLGLALPAAAQLDTGSISGTITDTTGRVIPSSQVTAVENATGISYATVSSKTGFYTFPSMHIGDYTLTVTAPGFKTGVLRAVTVSVGVGATHNFTLQVGAAAETVSVRANALQLQTQSSEIGTSIQPIQVEDLPLAVGGALRSLSTVTFLTPGAVGPGTSAGGAGGQIVAKINGGQTLGSDYLVDGISTRREENGSGGFDGLSPSVESISEFRESISALPADLGQTTGGIANFTSRSGTNHYHGVIYDFYKNAALDGNNWFNNGYLASATSPAARASLQRPPDTKNDYGVTLGGPASIPHIYNGHNRTFFFFSWEQLRYATGSSITSILPTAAVRGDNGQYADFSSFLGGPIPGNQIDNCTGQPILYGQIFDPQTVQYQYTSQECRSPFPGNKIPYSRFSSIAKNVLKLLPEPNLSGAGASNYVYNTHDTVSQTVYSVRIDQNISQRQKVWGFWNSRENTDGGNFFNLPPPLNSCCAQGNFYGKLFRAGWEWILTPNVLNDLTVGGNRTNNYSVSAASQMNSNWGAALGIPNGQGPTFPAFVFNGGTSYPSLGENSYAQDVDNALVLKDAVSWQHGAHSFKFGGEYRYDQFSFISKIGGTCSGTAGCFNFYPGQTAATLPTQGYGNSFAAFLIGQTGDVNTVVDLHAPRWIQTEAALFAEDHWRVSPDLTLNLGLRWSYDTPRHEADGDTAIMQPNVPNPGADGRPGALVFAGVGTGRNGNKNETWANTYYKDIAPRVGFAWQPYWLNHKVVVRGNGGIYYGPLVYADYGQGTTQGFTISTNEFNAGDPMSGPLLDDGLPVQPTQPNLDPTQMNGQSVDYVAPTYGKPAMVETWTLETQTQLSPDWVFSLGYLGMHSTRLHGLIDFPNDMPLSGLALGNVLFDNATSPQAIAAGVQLPYGNFEQTWGGGGTVQQALRPFPQYGYINTDSYLQNVGQSSYNALEAKLEHRFSNGLNVLASYTFSKTLTDADSIQPFYSTLQNQGGTQNPYDHKAEKAVSNEDVPNNFVVSYLYNLPVGQGQRFLSHSPKVVSAVISHWRISGVQRYLSGQPISFWGAPGIPGFDNGIRPDRVAGTSPYRTRGHYNPFTFSDAGGRTQACQTGYWNCAGFADPNANRGSGPFQFGTMPRNSADIRAFAFYDEDFGVNKTIPLREGMSIEFRGEMFNAFNRHIFNKPDSGLFDVNFGQIGSTLNGPRNVQFVLKLHY